MFKDNGDLIDGTTDMWIADGCQPRTFATRKFRVAYIIAKIVAKSQKKSVKRRMRAFLQHKSVERKGVLSGKIFTETKSSRNTIVLE